MNEGGALILRLSNFCRPWLLEPCQQLEGYDDYCTFSLRRRGFHFSLLCHYLGLLTMYVAQ
jgi:hypothetical protein